MMKLTDIFFKMSKEENVALQLLFGNVIIKCIAAPHHIKSFFSTEKMKIHPSLIHIFPEHELTIDETYDFVNNIVASKKDAYIVTRDINILRDLPKECVRILQRDGTLTLCDEKTFCANQHNIILSVLDDLKNTKSHNIFSVKIINNVIEMLQQKSITQDKYEYCKKIHEMIGEELIANAMQRYFYDIKITDSNVVNQYDSLEDEEEYLKNRIKELKELKKKKQK